MLFERRGLLFSLPKPPLWVYFGLHCGTIWKAENLSFLSEKCVPKVLSLLHCYFHSNSWYLREVRRKSSSCTCSFFAHFLAEQGAEVAMRGFVFCASDFLCFSPSPRWSLRNFNVEGERRSFSSLKVSSANAFAPVCLPSSVEIRMVCTPTQISLS